MNEVGKQGIAAAADAAAPVSDAVPGATFVACSSGETCSGGDWVMGGLGMLPAEGEEANAAASIVTKAVHGNSTASKAMSYLYRLTDSGGGLLKWGISKNPLKRYTQGFMQGKKMQIMMSGTRREMLNVERWIVEHDHGPLNNEPWAGNKAGGNP